MDVKEAAAELNGRQYLDECSNDLHRRMKAAGIVAVFGASDDLVYFAGAANNERGAGNGTKFYFTEKGFLENDCEEDRCPHFERAKQAAAVVRSKWDDGGFSWRYETEIPHEKFVIMEDDDTYCEGIVFALKDIGRKPVAEGGVVSRAAEILAKGDLVFPSGIAEQTQAFLVEHFPECADPAAVRAIALALNTERTRCARVVEFEAASGDAPVHLVERYALEATKESILKRIDSGEDVPVVEN